jgi:hypothetical protein
MSMSMLSEEGNGNEGEERIICLDLVVEPKVGPVTAAGEVPLQ